MKQDYLSRQPYLDLLKSIIANQKENQTGYSFAIDGEWGSGKTWILQELEKQLLEEKDNKFLIFHYNAWENDFYDEPLVAILSVMIEKLNEVTSQKSLYEATVDELLKQVSTDLLTLVGGVSKSLIKVDMEQIIKRKKGLLKRIKQDTKLSSQEINPMIPLKNTLSRVRENILKLAGKVNILIIVDELDRCLPEYAIKVLERLHHVCNEMPVIEILAINKKELAYGISKVFGMDNPNVDKEKFADKYLQKFVQVFIGLDNGKISEEDNFLNKIDGEYIQQLVIDKNYVLEFYKKLMNGISPRTQEYVCDQVNMVHKLAIITGNKMEQFSYGLLCCELMYCIKYLVLRDKTPFKVRHVNTNVFSIDSNISSYKRDEIIDTSVFNTNLDSIFRKNYNNYEITRSRPNSLSEDVTTFYYENAAAQLLNYFVEKYNIQTKTQETMLMDSVFYPERKFLAEFIKILEKL
ncbi:MAG: AAA family ATPase [Treponema sp.]|nr:AAA family ATPase [Treponema sp.]